MASLRQLCGLLCGLGYKTSYNGGENIAYTKTVNSRFFNLHSG